MADQVTALVVQTIGAKNYLYELLDCTRVSPLTDNDVLAYDSASGKFINQTAAQAGLPSLTGSNTYSGTNIYGTINGTVGTITTFAATTENIGLGTFGTIVGTVGTIPTFTSTTANIGLGTFGTVVGTVGTITTLRSTTTNIGLGTLGTVVGTVGTISTLTTGAITNSTGLAHGTYAPVATGISNLDGTPTMTVAQYMRVGNAVTISGRFTADPTNTLTDTFFETSLPVASNIGAAEDVAGVAYCGAIAAQGAAIYGVAANDTAIVQWRAADVTSQTWSYNLTYRVI